MAKKKDTLTTATGIPVTDNQHALTAGPHGPLLVQDWQFLEKHAHFNRERIPERVVHALIRAGDIAVQRHRQARSQFVHRGSSRLI